eukprot:5984194-Pyramimonas_sp.AAC.1
MTCPRLNTTLNALPKVFARLAVGVLQCRGARRTRSGLCCSRRANQRRCDPQGLELSPQRASVL